MVHRVHNVRKRLVDHKNYGHKHPLTLLGGFHDHTESGGAVARRENAAQLEEQIVLVHKG